MENVGASPGLRRRLSHYVFVLCVELLWFLRYLSCNRTMKDELQGSPYRRHRNDPEAGSGSRRYDDDEDGSPFNISRTKSAPIDQLRRWRVS